MATPRLEIRVEAIEHNARKLAALFATKGVRVTAVTKGVCGSPQIARALLRGGITSLADSHIANLSHMRQAGIEAEFMLIRSPKPSEAAQVVDLADISLNSEISVIRLLGAHAASRGRSHRVVLMVELGDLREGVMPGDLHTVVSETLEVHGIELAGIGTNIGCLRHSRPTSAEMETLATLACDIRSEFGIALPLISGGSSSAYQWFVSTADVGPINHMRIGESILLGREIMSGEPIPGLDTSAFRLIAEVIELKAKPAQPGLGGIAHPLGSDGGRMRRAILATGRQDIDPAAIKPHTGAGILGATSDHLVIDATKAPLEVGTEVSFDVGYSALLRAMASPYVEKVYLA